MTASTTRTIWELRHGEQLLLDGGRVVVELQDKSGKQARLLVTAPRDVKIEREECGLPRAMHGTLIA